MSGRKGGNLPGPPPAQYSQPQQYSYHGKPHYKKRKSFLFELFDD